MKQLLIPAAVAAVLSGVPAAGQAAGTDELAQIRSQLDALVKRVDGLEQENDALQAENEKLKAEGEYLKAETRGLRKDTATAAADVGKVKGADWAGKVAIKGDMRYRYEYISDAAVNAAGVQSTADRYRDRIRARLNVEAKATDNLLVGFGFATTEGGDPRSSNQTLTGVFSRKSLDLDLAWFDWKFASWGDLLGGKMKQPFFKPGQSAFWDGDVNPEGLAVAFNRGIWFGSAYNYWLSEISGAESAVTADAQMHGAQLGARLPIGGASTLVLAAHYYDLSAAQGRAPFYANNANGNTTTLVGTTNVLVNDYEVVNVAAEFNTLLGSLPLQVWADVAQNQDPDDLDTAWAAGVMFGKASNTRTWELGASYQTIEKDALFAQLIDSDFGGGVSDTEGWVLKAGYAPVKNWTLNATYFLNKRNVDVANSVGDTEIDYDRMQIDFNVKF
jgi:putative porin